MRAVKENKEYTIGEGQQKSYQDGGFDILGDDGRVIAYGRGKAVPYEEYMEVAGELARLKAGREPGAPDGQPQEKRVPKKAGG